MEDPEPTAFPHSNKLDYQYETVLVVMMFVFTRLLGLVQTVHRQQEEEEEYHTVLVLLSLVLFVHAFA